MNAKTILITGTTSGLGHEFLKHYSRSGCRVVAVNRRAQDDRAIFPNVDFRIADITDPAAVDMLLNDLVEAKSIPNVFILNAGINKPDNVDQFDLATFKEVIDVNLLGVMTFVKEIQRLKLTNRRIVTVSSTSNIVPNPGHLGYHISKLALKRLFDLMRTRDRANVYQTVVLGPVATNIKRYMPAQIGLQKRVFDRLAVEPEKAVAKLAGFLSSNRKNINYPFGAYLFYLCVRTVLAVAPGVYSGTTKTSRSPGP